MKPILLTAVLALQFVACNRNPDETAATFTLDSFERIAVPDAAGTVYRNDSLLLGNPQTIRSHPDGYLVLLDRTDDGQVTVIDLETDNVQHLIRRGRGLDSISAPIHHTATSFSGIVFQRSYPKASCGPGR